MADDFQLKWDATNQQLYGEDPSDGSRIAIPFDSVDIEDLTVSDNTFVRAHLSTDQSYSTGNNFVTVNIDTASDDRRSEFDKSNNKVTIDKDGLYIIHGSVRFDTGSSGDGLAIRLRAGGSAQQESTDQAGDSGVNTVESSTIESLTAGDDIKISAQNNDNDDTIISGSRFTNLKVVRVA